MNEQDGNEYMALVCQYNFSTKQIKRNATGKIKSNDAEYASVISSSIGMIVMDNENAKTNKKKVLHCQEKCTVHTDMQKFLFCYQKN